MMINDESKTRNAEDTREGRVLKTKQNVRFNFLSKAESNESSKKDLIRYESLWLQSE